MVTRSSAPPALESHPPRQHEYLLREDEIGDSVAQTVLLTYLSAVLAHLYRETGWFVARNLSFYHPAVRNSQNLISPDIAVFVGLALPPQEQRRVTSWEMRPTRARAQGHPGTRPAPTVVFEVSSGSTWKTDMAPGGGGQAVAVRADGRAGVRCLRPQRSTGVAREPAPAPAARPPAAGLALRRGGLPVALEPDAQGRLGHAHGGDVDHKAGAGRAGAAVERGPGELVGSRRGPAAPL